MGVLVILFLDFDGVLHPCGCATKDYLCALPRLVNFLQEPQHAHIEIVITSAWRTNDSFENGVFKFALRPLEELRQHFPEDIRHRVIGMTPCLGTVAQLGRVVDSLVAMSSDTYRQGKSGLLQIII